jgi:ribonuclease HI
MPRVLAGLLGASEAPLVAGAEPSALPIPAHRLASAGAWVDGLFPPLCPLRWAPDVCLFSDGSCKQGEPGLDGRARNTLGAAFFSGAEWRSPAPASGVYRVAPCGDGSTNTITRAELAGLEALLGHACSSSLYSAAASVHAFVDSLSALYLVRRCVLWPSSLRECKHLHLVRAAVGHVLARARRGLTTRFWKVKAHSGVAGNEEADRGAELARLDPRACHLSTASQNDSLHCLPAWPVIISGAAAAASVLEPPPPRPAPGALLPVCAAEPEAWFSLSDLCGAVKRVVQDGPLAVGFSRCTTYTAGRAEVNAASLPGPSNAGWDAAKWPQVRTVLLARFGQLMTNKRAHQMGLAGALGGCCPECGGADSVGHLLGGCAGSPHVRALRVARHNALVRLVADAVLRGD